MENGSEPPVDRSENLVSVFRDAEGHMRIADIIRDHLVGRQDVREIALGGLDLSQTRSVLDLGCGYGFFSSSLSRRLHPEARLLGIDKHEQYRAHYLNACEEAGLNSTFMADGADMLSEMADNTFDLIICSYALYFFPGYIKYIARVLKNEGHFVAITHSRPHMKELTSLVRAILREKHPDIDELLPYGELISHFSNENGWEMLSEWFHAVDQVEYKNTLIFSIDDFDDFENYFHYKRDFFIPFGKEDDELTKWVISRIKERVEEGPLGITKDDMIFICSGPRKIL